MNLFQLNLSPGLVHPILLQLRDPAIQKDRLRFKFNLERLGFLLAAELAKTLPVQKVEVETVLGKTEIPVPQQPPVLVTVLRAGLAFYQGFANAFDDADSGFIGAYRVEGESAEQLEIRMNYAALPDLTGRDLILIDPMLATGCSLLKVWQLIASQATPRSVHVAAAIAAPEGVAALQQHLPENSYLWLGALDQQLNEQAYIVPGLGDAGDLCFGPKL
ncbi:uracil phosphoribosyltransferase [Rheinheimera sp. A13L]|uniref:uracil phosphoribosyltransferase n=1 Tax=Rheinheimera sp. A13L TaxID=506534 RepID=UPI0002124A38|nr:uracil phosphoribosyltransferase [Rheinheimera sp. A13L]EGM78304.1 uracil phosphoribosyltransferase [Rheinheimera sp. A13L]